MSRSRIFYQFRIKLNDHKFFRPQRSFRRKSINFKIPLENNQDIQITTHYERQIGFDLFDRVIYGERNRIFCPIQLGIKTKNLKPSLIMCDVARATALTEILKLHQITRSVF